MIVETTPGTWRLKIAEDGRLRMDDFRQLQEQELPGIAWRVADELDLALPDFYREIRAGRILARYEGDKLVMETT